MPVVLGTSGWQYAHWRERFYPQGLAQKRWLEHFAEAFASVEINNSFYMLPKPETFASWAERTPHDFVVAVKANRYITHIKRMRDAGPSVERFLEHARRLGSKLGPILLQLPPNLRADLDALDETLGWFPADLRVTVEFRHRSWFTDETRAILERRGAALCLADRGSKPVAPLWRTADWTYLRFHQGEARPMPCYGRGALKTWARRLAEGWAAHEDVYVYFNNDPEGCAIRDAIWFAGYVRSEGFDVTRVPGIRSIRVG